MFENILIGLIIILAGAYVLRSFLCKSGRSGCSCSCSSCGPANNPDEQDEQEKRAS